MLKLLSASLLICLAGCVNETEESILASFASRMGKDLTEHRGTITEASNFSAFRESGSTQKPEFFLKMQLQDKSCILVATDINGLIPSDNKDALAGKSIAYRFAPAVLKQWPFSVFDLNRDCLPAVSLGSPATPASPVLPVQGG